MTVIRLDWDDISFSECKRRISLIMKYSIVKSLELRLSATSGFHIIVSCYNNNFNPFYLRRIWKDDGRRLVGDMLDAGAPYRDVMFQYKVIGGFTWYEEPICTYTRLGNSDRWKIKRASHLSQQLEPLLS